MHELDQMTPNQRLNAFMTGQSMDRMLAMPVIVSMSGDVCGMTHREKRSSPENEAKCQIEAYKRFGNDLAVIEYGLHMVGVGLGGTTNDPEFQTPAIATYPLESLDDIDKLDPERLKKENDPHLRHCLEACRIVKEEIGDEVPVGVLITGPYTAATSCYPAEKLFRAMRKSPEKVHRLVQFTTDCLIDIYKEFIQEGVLILQCDPLASGTILRKSQYQEFVLPYAKKVNQAIHDAVEKFRQKCPDASFAIGECLNADPFELSLALIRYGFSVPEIYGTITVENFTYIRSLAKISPETKVFSNMEPTMIYYDPAKSGVNLAIGKDACYYHPDCPYVMWNGEEQPYGYAGVRRLFEQLLEVV